jgi:hypothetical protein
VRSRERWLAFVSDRSLWSIIDPLLEELDLLFSGQFRFGILNWLDDNPNPLSLKGRDRSIQGDGHSVQAAR